MLSLKGIPANEGLYYRSAMIECKLFRTWPVERFRWLFASSRGQWWHNGSLYWDQHDPTIDWSSSNPLQISIDQPRCYASCCEDGVAWSKDLEWKLGRFSNIGSGYTELQNGKGVRTCCSGKSVHWIVGQGATPNTDGAEVVPSEARWGNSAVFYHHQSVSLPFTSVKK